MKKKEPEHSDHYNPRDNFATFDNNNIPKETTSLFRRLIRPVKILGGVLAALCLAFGLIFLLGYLRPDLFPYFSYDSITSAVSVYFPGNKENSVKKPNVGGSESIQSEPAKPKETDRVYTQAQVEQVKRELLLKKRVELARERAVVQMSEQDHSTPPEKKEESIPQYSYEIILFSGTHIFTDNLQLTKDTISYDDVNGLQISINRDEVQKVTRTPKSIMQ